jgi:hypothetical protein
MNTFTADDDIVKQALAGIYKSRTIYFRIGADGSHIRAKLTAELRALGASYYEVTQIFQTFPFPELTYESNRMKRIAAGLGKPKGKAARVRYVEEEEDEDILEDEEAVMEAATGDPKKRNKQYSIIERGNYHGVYNGRDGSLTLFRTRREAESHLAGILNGKTFKPFYGSKI